jgi:prevent-host-death family protein
MRAYPIPRTVGVSDLRTRQKEILSQLPDGPVVLSQHNQPTAVLVDVALWNSLVEELEALQDAQVARERMAEASRHPELLERLEDVEAELVAGHSDDA